MIFGICRINRNQRDVAPVFALALRDGLNGFSFVNNTFGKDVRNFIGKNRNDGGRFFSFVRADNAGYFRTFQTVFRPFYRFNCHKIAILRVAQEICRDFHFALTTHSRFKPYAIITDAYNAQHLRFSFWQYLDDFRAVAIGVAQSEYFR